MKNMNLLLSMSAVVWGRAEVVYYIFTYHAHVPGAVSEEVFSMMCICTFLFCCIIGLHG